MQDLPTSELEAQLEKMQTSELGEYFKRESDQMTDEKKGFYYYMSTKIKEKGLLLKDVYSFADVSESYGAQILRMEKHTTNRDLIIRLCIAGHFKIEEINRALKIYGMSPLYAKDRRDASLIVAINNRHYNLFEINESLERHGFKPLLADKD